MILLCYQAKEPTEPSLDPQVNFVIDIDVCIINYPRSLRHLDFKWLLVLFGDEAFLCSVGGY